MWMPVPGVKKMLAASMRGRSFSTKLSRLLANLLHQTLYCWCCRTLVTIHWMHRSVNGIVISPFGHKKWITERCSLQNNVVDNVAVYNIYNWRHSDVILTKLTAGIHKLNFLKNVYFGFFMFWKLTEWCRFVTYLRDDCHNYTVK